MIKDNKLKLFSGTTNYLPYTLETLFSDNKLN